MDSKTLAVAAILGIPLIGICPAHAGVVADGPQSFSQLSSLGKVLRNAEQNKQALHILYVHGMGYVPLDDGDSRSFREGICRLLPGCQLPSGRPPRDYADKGRFADKAPVPVYEYLGKPVWTDAPQWEASAPYVDHYVLRLSNGGSIVVDEINWWPLVLPLKCRVVMADDARLAGPDPDLINLCAKATTPDTRYPDRFLTYQWLNLKDAGNPQTRPQRGAWLNRTIKGSILDWGFADAMMALGSMHDLFREGMRQLFVKSARFHADGSSTGEWEQQATRRSPDREFIAVTHSLGSYLVFSTLSPDTDNAKPVRYKQPENDTEREDLAARYILARTSLIYFFANQVSLLELANIEEKKDSPAEPASANGPAKPGPSGSALPTNSLVRQLGAWKQLRQDFKAGSRPQFVAWSDPSDLLSWYVPAVEDADVVNLYVRNSWWHWIFADPTTAHDGYANNLHVLRTMLDLEKPTEIKRARE
ncbi:MAG TPA: hypothetical protein VGL82_14545 [Bryobacteraceae bacterium]|jgi:hypothetical protein